MSRRWAFAFVVAAVMWVAGDVDTEARKAPRIVAPRPEVVARTYRDDLRWMASNRDRVFWLGGRVAVDSFVKINRRTELFEWGPWNFNAVIAADDDMVFWDGGEWLLALSTKGPRKTEFRGAPQAKPIFHLAPNAILTGITLDVDAVYVMEQGKRNSLFRIPRQGGEAKDLGAYGSLGCGEHLVNDATHVYWTDQVAPWIYRVAKTGGRRESLLRTGSPEGLAVDDKELCFVNAWSPEIECMDKQSGVRRVVTSGKFIHPTAIVMDGEALYFVDQGGPPRQDPNHPEISLSDPRLRVRDGAVYRVPRAGGVATKIAGGQDAPIDLLVDATHVYWLSRRAGTIWRAPK